MRTRVSVASFHGKPQGLCQLLGAPWETILDFLRTYVYM